MRGRSVKETHQEKASKQTTVDNEETDNGCGHEITIDSCIKLYIHVHTVHVYVHVQYILFIILHVHVPNTCMKFKKPSTQGK